MVRSTGKATALGARLRATREAQDVSQRALDKLLRWGTGTTSRIETGERPPDTETVATILDALGIADPERAEILELAQDSGSGSTWYATTLPEQAAQMAALLELEQRADRAYEISPLIVPGVFQTRAYTRAIMHATKVPSHEVEPKVSMRMGRRDILTRKNPVTMTAIIGERVLRDRIGGAAVMAEQLDHLAAVSRLDNVDLRVLPDGIGWTPAHIGAFYLLELSGTSLVHIELKGSAIFLEDKEDVAAYRMAVDEVLSVAMSAVLSTELIAHAADEIRGSDERDSMAEEQSQ